MRLRHIKGCEEYIKNNACCICGADIYKYQGKWNKLFGNQNPIHIEIGMGKGQFIRDMSKANPLINYIGIERYETIIMKALQRKERLENSEFKYNNLLFMCLDANELEKSFNKDEIDKIYLNFSDPWPKLRHENRRLTSKHFLDIYEKILKKDACLEFKTDKAEFFNYSVESIKDAGWNLEYINFDFHSCVEAKDNIMTEYEEKFSSLGNKICKLIARR